MSAEVAIPAATIISGLTALVVGAISFVGKAWVNNIRDSHREHAEMLAQHAERIVSLEAQNRASAQRFDELRADLRAISAKLDRLIEGGGRK